MLKFLEEKWHRSGVEKEDTILLHSNIRRTLIECYQSKLKIEPNDIINSFLNVIGSKGTLILPLFNFDFTHGVDFNINTTKSQMGTLSEAGRIYKDAVRTGHPIYSFAIIGHKSNQFEEVDNESAFAEDSPFGILKRLNGKIASLDLDDQNSMTFYHHVEEISNVDYRYFKSFEGKYIDKNNQIKNKSYKIFVRDLEKGVITNVNPAGELLWKANLYKGFRPKIDTGLRLIKAVDMFNFVENIITSGNALNILYSLNKK